VPAFYQLLGFPGTGKYTVAKEIVAQLAARDEPAALLDNHATANLVWSLVPESRRFDDDVMARMHQLRLVLMDAVVELTSPEHSLVFTNFVPAGRPTNLLDGHRDVAARLGRPLVAVVLRCDEDEVLRRVPSPERAERYKLVEPRIARRIMDAGMTLPDWPELVHLDTTGLSAAETAARVIALADQI
jgi:hypothetical protein